MLIANGGSDSGRLDLDDVLSPHRLEAFLARVVETTRKTKRFMRDWERLYQLIPRLQGAWEQGQVQFHDDLHRAKANEEEMEYLSEVDFAADCYASCAAHNMYPHHYALQAWVINGYMLAWRQHFLADEDHLSTV
jgi:hypothetical protein